jgi:hypothetical protein
VPIVKLAGWLLGGGFVFLMTAAIRDWMHNDST